MPGLFARLKNWKKNEVLTDDDINNEFNWFLQNLVPLEIDDYSESVAQMQIQTSPGAVGSESQASSVAGEFERIRYMLALITGQTYWYSTPPRSLSTGAVELGFYLPFEGKDADEAWMQTVRRGVMPQCTQEAEVVNATTSALLDFDSANLVTTQAKFGTRSWAIGSSKFLAVPGPNSSVNVGTLACHYYNYGAGDYIAYNPLLGLEFYLDSFGKLTAKMTTRQTGNSQTAKATQTVASAVSSSGVAAWQHAMLKYQINGIAGVASDKLAIQRVQAGEEVSISAQDLRSGAYHGGCWFFGAKRTDPVWSHFSSMNIVPDGETVNPYTLTGSTATRSITEDGLLHILTDTTNKGCAFSLTGATTITGVDTNSMTMEIKMRLKSYAFWSSAANETGVYNVAPFQVRMRSSTRQRSVNIGFWRNGFFVCDNDNNGGAVSTLLPISMDCSTWHIYRFTFSAGVVKVYVDGVYVGTLTLASADATANDFIGFGDFDNSTSGHDVDAEVEWFGFGPLPVAPFSTGAAGNLDDVAFLESYITDAATETSLSTSPVPSVIGKDKTKHDFFRYAARMKSTTTPSNGSPDTSSAAKWVASGDTRYYPSDGITPIDIQLDGVVSQATITSAAYFMMACSSEEPLLTSGLSGGLVGQNVLAMTSCAAAEFWPVTCRRKSVFPKGVVAVTAYIAGDGAHVVSHWRAYSRANAVYGMDGN